MSGLKFAGDIRVKQVTVVSRNGMTLNVLNQVQSIEIYEDMLSPFMSVAVTLRESHDLLNLFPLLGEEYLHIDLETPDINVPIKQNFYIYKMTDRVYTKDREVMYTLRGMSEEFLVDVNTRISKALAGNVSELAGSLIGEDGLNTKKKINVDRSINRTKVVPSGWHPLEAIKQLSIRAISEHGSPSFLFFENRDGFNFKSVNKLLQQPARFEFVKDNYSRQGRSSNDLSSVKDPGEDFKRIIDMDIPVVTDYIGDIKSGQLKSQLISYDIVTKKYAVRNYKIEESDSFTLLNSKLPYTSNAISSVDSKLFIEPLHYNNYDDYADITDAQMVQKRVSFFKNLEKHKMHIEVLGRTDYTVGMVVNLDIPRVAEIRKGDSDHRDVMLSGKYLTTAVTHFMSRSQHTCKIELVKNSIIETGN